MYEINYVEVLGLVAGAFTAFSSVPQTYRIAKLKQADSVSLTTYVMWNTSCVLWLIYGLINAAISIVFWNTIAFFMTGSVIILKLIDLKKAN